VNSAKNSRGDAFQSVVVVQGTESSAGNDAHAVFGSRSFDYRLSSTEE
jgi:hypothetical protein